MKKLLLVTFSFLLILNYARSQSPENQWLIWNGAGKNGFDNTSYTNTYATTPISSSFSLTGVASPVLPSPVPPPDKYPRNDLLVIYSDGNYFNTRYAALPGNFYSVSSGGGGAAVTNHNFTSTRTIRYMYLTNRYEGDDLPSLVRAVGGLPAPGANVLATSSNDYIVANHDVVYGTDITLIINYDSIRHAVANQEPISLNFSGIKTPGGTLIPGQNFLDLQPVFGPAPLTIKHAVYPNPSGDPGTSEEIPIEDAGGPYRYVNLRPNSNLNYFLPRPKESDFYKAVFTIKNGGLPIGTLEEPIRLSHDPNFLRVESICKAADGSYLVSYRLQFENDGDGEAKDLDADITFPPQFDLNCLVVHEWHVGGLGCRGDLIKNGSTVKFDFKDHGKLVSKLNSLIGCIGFVTFTVRVNPGIDVTDTNVSLKLGVPTVFFDHHPYPLNLFYDLLNCKEDGKPSASSSEPEDQASKEKKDTFNIDHKDAKAKSALVSQPIGSMHCSRPLSQGPCKCKDPFCFKCVVGAFAIILILVILIRKKFKKTSPPVPPSPAE
jgi:hypothetical protein